MIRWVFGQGVRKITSLGQSERSVIGECVGLGDGGLRGWGGVLIDAETMGAGPCTPQRLGLSKRFAVEYRP